MNTKPISAPVRRRMSAVFKLTDGGSKPLQVALAVSEQLAADGRRPRNLATVMGAGYNYARPSMYNFLDGVKARLADDTPAYTFDFDDAFVLKALTQSLGTLMGSIDLKTK